MQENYINKYYVYSFHGVHCRR